MNVKIKLALVVFSVVLMTGYIGFENTKKAGEQNRSAGPTLAPSEPRQSNKYPTSGELSLGVDALSDPIFNEKPIFVSPENVMDPIIETRLVAQATSHMSDRQMFEFQTLRKGTIVRRVDGTLNAPYERQKRCDEENICLQVIIDRQTGNVVWDGKWSKNLVETDVGQEVVWRSAEQ